MSTQHSLIGGSQEAPGLCVWLRNLRRGRRQPMQTIRHNSNAWNVAQENGRPHPHIVWGCGHCRGKQAVTSGGKLLHDTRTLGKIPSTSDESLVASFCENLLESLADQRPAGLAFCDLLGSALAFCVDLIIPPGRIFVKHFLYYCRAGGPRCQAIAAELAAMSRGPPACRLDGITTRISGRATGHFVARAESIDHRPG